MSHSTNKAVARTTAAFISTSLVLIFTAALAGLEAGEGEREEPVFFLAAAAAAFFLPVGVRLASSRSRRSRSALRSLALAFLAASTSPLVGHGASSSLAPIMELLQGFKGFLVPSTAVWPASNY